MKQFRGRNTAIVTVVRAQTMVPFGAVTSGDRLGVIGDA